MTQRTYVVTGAASGIGAASKEMLEAQGHRVIGVDLRETEVIADLSDAAGRRAMVEGVGAACDGRLDGVLAVAGLVDSSVATAKVNYFGTVATLEGLRPMLARSHAPRAVAVSSMSLTHSNDAALASALARKDEVAAIARAEFLASSGSLDIYTTTKRAVARWVRRQAPTADWAGAGIALNAIAPGIVDTPMMADALGDEDLKQLLLSAVPMPLNGVLAAADVAEALCWLASERNTHMCGQVIFLDGGSEVLLRGEDIFPAE